jgi:hypothetical protein
MGDYFGSRDRRWNYWISGIGVAIGTPLYVFALLTTNINLMWLAFLFGAFAQALYLAPVIAMAHTLVGPERRALSSAFIYLVLNIIGLGMGPLMVGMISDALEPSMGIASLRWGMMSASMAGLVGGYCFFLAARHFNDDLRSQSVAV